MTKAELDREMREMRAVISGIQDLRTETDAELERLRYLTGKERQ